VAKQGKIEVVTQEGIASARARGIAIAPQAGEWRAVPGTDRRTYALVSDPTVTTTRRRLLNSQTSETIEKRTAAKQPEAHRRGRGRGRSQKMVDLIRDIFRGPGRPKGPPKTKPVKPEIPVDLFPPMPEEPSGGWEEVRFEVGDNVDDAIQEAIEIIHSLPPDAVVFVTAHGIWPEGSPGGFSIGGELVWRTILAPTRAGSQNLPWRDLPEIMTEISVRWRFEG